MTRFPFAALWDVHLCGGTRVRFAAARGRPDRDTE